MNTPTPWSPYTHFYINVHFIVHPISPQPFIHIKKLAQTHPNTHIPSPSENILTHPTMKKHLYLLLPLLTLAPTLATQKIITSTIIASTLALSPTTQQPSPNTQQPRKLHDLDEKYILNLILNNSLRKAKIKKHLPSELRGLIHTFFIHEWTIHGFHKDTGTIYDPHDFDINGIHKQTKTNLDPRGFTQNGDYKDLDLTTGKPTKYDPQDYNIDRWNKDGFHENGTKVNNKGFAQHVNHASIHLHTAIDNLDKRALTLLLKNPNINVQLKQYGLTPLICCCIEGDKLLGIAKALIEYDDININLRDNDGCTPLIRCCYEVNKSLKIAKALLEHENINVNLQDNYGWTPLIMCAYRGDKSLPIAQVLLGHQHININLQQKDGYTPLDIIIYWIKKNKEDYKYVQLWNILVAKGAVLNKHRTDYHNLKPSDFKEPHKGYVRLIKQNLPKN